jgi:ribose 5-phosphate isomerase RpiB
MAEDEEDATLMRQHNDVNVLCLSGKKTPPKLGQKNSRRLHQREI